MKEKVFENLEWFTATFIARCMLLVTALLIGIISPFIGGLIAFITICNANIFTLIAQLFSIGIGIKVYECIRDGSIYETTSFLELCIVVIVTALVGTLATSLNKFTE